MILISMDRLKALNMTDIKGYFIYAEMKDSEFGFPFGDEKKYTAYGLYVNMGWLNARECASFSVGQYGTLAEAIIAMETLTMIFDVAQEGYVTINPNATIDFCTSAPL